MLGTRGARAGGGRVPAALLRTAAVPPTRGALHRCRCHVPASCGLAHMLAGSHRRLESPMRRGRSWDAHATSADEGSAGKAIALRLQAPRSCAAPRDARRCAALEVSRAVMNVAAAAGGQLCGSRHRVARGAHRRSCGAHLLPSLPARGVLHDALYPAPHRRRRSHLLRCGPRLGFGHCRRACAVTDASCTSAPAQQQVCRRPGPRYGRQPARGGKRPAGGGLLGACLPTREAHRHGWHASVCFATPPGVCVDI